MKPMLPKCVACGCRYSVKFEDHEKICEVLLKLRSRSKPILSLVRQVSDEEFYKMESESGRNCGEGVCSSYCRNSHFGKWHSDE